MKPPNLEELVRLANACIRSISEDRREEFYQIAFDAALEAHRTHRVRKSSYRSWVRRIIRHRVQDRWRQLDPLTRTQRARLNGRVLKGYQPKCKSCAVARSKLLKCCPRCNRRFKRHPVSLTGREIEVWKLIGAGAESAGQIAKVMDISLHTASYYLLLLTRKLGVDRVGTGKVILLIRAWYKHHRSPRIKPPVSGFAPSPYPTPRELALWRVIGEGASSLEEITERLAITESSVRCSARNLSKRLKVGRSGADLILGLLRAWFEHPLSPRRNGK